ncbi:hypothetical protein BU23DRAFT_592797 [Bimuria novae-zelandiae CBS 107.79]|uniref:Uncharacterized protein n=1 Tax=Bimuria novae-zelandiae CBS 107.79 TaxID=1447943 RepID=A0A6A5UQE9_9PLEO|nr:hypothetical protein BU23DRAFT_592797 [Bimuria novae-zelandiae CBS 107.79]
MQAAMSFAQEHPSPLPPPPPPASQSPRVGYPQQPQAQTSSPLRRIAVQPPIITTQLAPHPGQYTHGHTPASANVSSFSPYAPSPSVYSASPVVPPSPMTMRSQGYNPQQWARSGGTVGGQYVPHSATQTPVATRAHEVTGMEASMPSPPPPYSPGQNPGRPQNANPGSSPHMSAAAFAASHPPPPPPPSDYTSSPSSRPTSGFFHSRPGSVVIPQSATSVASLSQFPPPPPATGSKRSASRDKLASKFSLSKFRDRTSGSPGPSNIDALRISTSEALQRPPASPGIPPPRSSHQILPNAFPTDHRWSPETQSPVRAPGARRAASTGVLASELRTPIDETPTLPQGTWGHGAPLPPPPPIPPPPGSRSQSLGRGMDAGVNRMSVHAPAPPTRRPGQGTLTPIPPTPVGWQDEPSRQRSRSPAAQGLQIDTSPRALQSIDRPPQLIDNENGSIASGPTASTSNSGSTLYRDLTGGQASRGIRERRSESRAARERIEPNNNPWAQDMEAAKPADLVLGSPEGGLKRRDAVTKNTPRSGGLRSPKSSHSLGDPVSSTSTPRLTVLTGAAPSPPFSAGTERLDISHTEKQPMSFPSKALPTPPMHNFGNDVEGLADSSGVRNRSTSNVSHHSGAQGDLSLSSTPRPMSSEHFAESAVERHRQFIEKEIAAQSDQDRLELFAEYIVNESRLRRDRYSAAFDAMAGDIMDLTRDLFRSYNNSGRRSATPSAQSASVVPSGRKSQASTSGESPDTRQPISIPTTAASPASSVANYTPHTEPASPSSATSQRARDASWNYKPVLSPIPSMAMSTVPDEEDSRGRSASRWWEASNDGASSGIGSRRMERSKRESKYMSLPKEARENLQWIGEDEPSPAQRGESSSRPSYGPNEYPPEKVGLHELTLGKQDIGYYPNSTPTTPDPRKLDVSRLVTLPPSYPRHHPAVNNSHPDLTSIRNSLRNIADLEEVKTTKEAFRTKMAARKEQQSASLADRSAQLRYNIQENIRNGVMSYGDAANAEKDFEAREHKRAQDLVQNIFDTFQAEVANPLHAMFCERITKTTASLEQLKGRLSNAAQELNPNQTQEEGDEQPELLEMLTLLKWLFEAREQLHKEMFELEDERNDLYKEIVILPYAQIGNDQKVKEATDFFRGDAQDRKVTWEKEILKRYEDFMNVVEANVTRGVETQLSAFWDIAPGLLAIVQKIPQRLNDFEILIPPQEYEENPSYYDFPLQYLYTLLAHTGRSAYQFIESQINLLCLLHEVKTGVMHAGSRLLETQRIMEGEDLESVDREMKAIKEDEERRLTDDLKEKVALVESQWNEALGGVLSDCKNRVESFLAQQGGWEDCLQD